MILMFVLLHTYNVLESGSLPRQKRRYISTSATTSNKSLMSIYHRMVEVISTLAQLLNLQTLTDMTVLKVSCNT